jgi:nucleotide-binding universal stress UspA family protein
VRLLVAYDGSEGGRDALELARVLCTATGAGALVVDVIYAGPLPMEFALLPEEEAAEAGPAFAAAREHLEGIEVETRAYGGGSPAAILTAITEEEEIDGIVVGSPHRSGLGRLLSGSVALGVLNGAHTDVYVAPPGYADAPHAGLGTVAVGYLGTPESKEALRRALQLVDRDGRIEILTVVEPPIPLSPSGENLTKPLDPEQVSAEGIGMVPTELAVEARKLSGAAAPELEKACATGVDLLVLGSRGYGPVRRVLLGSASGHAVRHAPCPVLVTRRP